MGEGVPKVHNLECLFKKLPARQQGKIMSNANVDDFDGLLGECANLFIEKRYFHEYPNSGGSFFFLQKLSGAVEAEMATEIEKSANK